MRKYIFIAVLALSAGLSSCEIDNFDGPNATFSGAIRDSLDGNLVEQDLVNGSAIEAVELGYESEVFQRWVIKNSGEFENRLVFANRYDFYLRNGNFFPYTIENHEIKAGDNTHDFNVVPFLRIRNLNINHDAAGNKVVATFNVDAGKPQAKLKSIRLYAFTDVYVGEFVKFNTVGSEFAQVFPTAKDVDATTYTLTIDLAANPTLFTAGRNYYFRVGALAQVPNVGTIRHNYAPYVKISL